MAIVIPEGHKPLYGGITYFIKQLKNESFIGNGGLAEFTVCGSERNIL